MKYILILLFLISPLLSQDGTWARKIRFGNKFISTDSTILRSSGLTDSLFASGDYDTLFSDAIGIYSTGLEGIYGIAAYFDEVSGTSASIGLDVRFGVSFKGDATRIMRWESDWHNIWSCKKDTLYRIEVPSDSTWWMPSATHRQYRLREADADTVLHNVADFIR